MNVTVSREQRFVEFGGSCGRQNCVHCSSPEFTWVQEFTLSTFLRADQRFPAWIESRGDAPQSGAPCTPWRWRSAPPCWMRMPSRCGYSLRSTRARLVGLPWNRMDPGHDRRATTFSAGTIRPRRIRPVRRGTIRFGGREGDPAVCSGGTSRAAPIPARCGNSGAGCGYRGERNAVPPQNAPHGSSGERRPSQGG
jgi:hypothetical protein